MERTASSEESTQSGLEIPTSGDFWSDWPRWDDENIFRTPNLTFVSSWSKPEEELFTHSPIPVHKPRGLLNCYRNLLQGRDTRAIAEIGYLHGGMAIFLADMMPRAKVIGIDRNPPPEAIAQIVDKKGLRGRAHFYGGVSQENRDLVRGILDKELGNEPLDLIMDDASHFYTETKATFEACFGYLRPGGKYIIEDWGWAHWNDPQWQKSKQFSDRTPLTVLLFELTMLLASRPRIVAGLDILDGSIAVITRGSELAHRAPIDIDSSYLTAGRRFIGFAND